MSFIGNVPAEAYSPVAKDTFSGNDSTTDFTLSIPATTNSVNVYVENVAQEPTTAYTISGTTLSFTAAPVTGTNNIYVIHRGPAVQQIVPPAGVALNPSDVTATGNLSVAGTTTLTDDLNVDSGTLFVDASANSVGIGTTSPTFTSGYTGLHINADYPEIHLTNSGSGATATDGFKIQQNSGQNAYLWNYESAFVAVGTNNTERMRILSGGNVLIGRTTNFGSGFKFALDHSGSILGQVVTSDATGTKYAMLFHDKNSGDSGSITYNGASTSFNTSSDYRLKEDVKPMVGSIDRLMALNPVNFAWKIDGSRVDGFIAHEAQEIVPESVTGEKDAMRTEEYEITPAVLDDEGNVVTEAVIGEREVPDYQGIDQAKLVPLLTGALKEAIARIETLEAEVATLKGASA